ncbi:hypothetical protein GYA13_02775 [Candidatus Kuenenbacteria bacterium]|nr:hypothetical protein [Candidatus Kuenenbacteria bacterium]
MKSTNYHQLFTHLKPAAPPTGLLTSVMSRLARAERRAIFLSRCRLFFVSLLLLGSLGSLIPVFKIISTDLSSSNFFSYLSLLFSDFSIIIDSWQSYTFTILESLPVFSLTLGLGLTLVVLAALRFFVRDFRVVFSRQVMRT